MWMYSVIVGLLLVGMLTFELLFIISFIGFLILIELTAPYAVRPRWRARLRWFVVLGFVGFGYLVVRRLLSILPAELL